MAFTAQVLAEGQVATSVGALYTVPTAKAVYMTVLTLGNINAAQQTVDLYFKRGANPRRFLRRYLLSQFESAELVLGGKALLMEAGDAIEAVTTTASAVDFLLCGVDEDV